MTTFDPTELATPDLERVYQVAVESRDNADRKVRMYGSVGETRKAGIHRTLRNQYEAIAYTAWLALEHRKSTPS